MQVKLSLTEWHHAVQTAVLRMMVSSASRLKHAATYERNWAQRLDEEVTGSVGEIAVAKSIGQFHIGSVNTFHRVPDCLRNAEVRATRRENGCLIVRDNDADDRQFVLVVGDPPVVRIAGYLRGADAKRAEWLRDPHGHRPAWFVPQGALRPIDELLHLEVA
jgi:hypothetical protein